MDRIFARSHLLSGQNRPRKPKTGPGSPAREPEALMSNPGIPGSRVYPGGWAGSGLRLRTLNELIVATGLGQRRLRTANARPGRSTD